MIYPIYILGSPVLRQDAAPVESRDQIPGQLIADMFETMRQASGVGLAAPQIGIPLRLFVVDLTIYADEDPSLEGFRKAFINPEIYERSEKTESAEEGCLSLPGIHEDVTRPVSVRIRYTDENWVEHDEELTGYPARVVQHEYDHLESTVFTDRLTPLRKTLIKNKLSAMSKGKYKASYKTKLKA